MTGAARIELRPDYEITRVIRGGWQQRNDRGAEQRLELGDRRAFVPITTLKKDPHLEMHTRGG